MDLAIKWARQAIQALLGKPVEEPSPHSASEGSSTATSTQGISSARNRKQAGASASAPSPRSAAPTSTSHTGTAHIRHLYIEPMYRRHHCATDLVNHALAHTFGANVSPAISRAIVRCPGSATGGARQALAQLGFDAVDRQDGWVTRGAGEKGGRAAESGKAKSLAQAEGWLADQNHKLRWISLPGSQWLELKKKIWEKGPEKQK